MLLYYRRNPLVSFGFVAAPDLDEDIRHRSRELSKGSRRFHFYQRLMLTLFGPKTFFQIADSTNTIYLLVNNTQLSKGNLTLKDIEDSINRTYEGDYIISD